MPLEKKEKLRPLQLVSDKEQKQTNKNHGGLFGAGYLLNFVSQNSDMTYENMCV